VNGTREAVERHHLFPKGHLKTLKIVDTRETNQIANFAYLEWGDNGDVLDDAPKNYAPRLASRFKPEELQRMYRWHALPEGWENLEYPVFLEKRRDLIAQVIRDGYRTLCGTHTEEVAPVKLTVAQLVGIGESDQIEFKSTLRVNQHTGQKDPRMELAVLKTIAGFLNTNGGRLIVGVRDDGTPLGIQADDFQSEDKMGLHLVNLVNSRMGPHAMTYAHARFDEYEDRRVLVVDCRKSAKPIFVKEGEAEYFFIRTGPSTTELTPSQTQDYIRQRWE
jgi:hypothetical protein